MKLAVQDSIVPGRSLSEKLDRAADLGFEGMELWGAGLTDRFDEVARACENHPVKISTICAGYDGCLVDPDEGEREKAVGDIKRLLEVGGALGAVGLIVVPVLGGPKLPDLSPMKTAEALEEDLLVDLLGPLAAAGAEAKCLVLVEPLNRYETHLVRRLGDAVRIVRRVGSKGIAIMADFFHMHLEEDDPSAAIWKAGKRIRHVHLADSQRMQPGTGHLNFRRAFRALKAVGYSDYMALECGIRGAKARGLAESVAFIKKQLR